MKTWAEGAQHLLAAADVFGYRDLADLWLIEWRKLWVRKRVDDRKLLATVLTAPQDRLADALAAAVEKKGRRGINYSAKYALEDMATLLLAPPPKPKAEPAAVSMGQRVIGRADCPHGCDDGWFYADGFAGPCPHCSPPELQRHVGEYVRAQRDQNSKRPAAVIVGGGR